MTAKIMQQLPGIGEASSEVIIRVPPSNTENLSLLVEYLDMIYPVIRVEVRGTESQVIRLQSGNNCSADELRNAQNFVLRFLGPESFLALILSDDMLKLCTLDTIRRYLTISCRVIVTVKGNCVILRGPCETTRCLNSALEKLQNATVPENDRDKAIKLRALQQLCSRLSIEFNQLELLSVNLKSGLLDLLIEMESKRMTELQRERPTDTACPSTMPSAAAASPKTNEPAFVEAFRKPINTVVPEPANPKPARRKRLRPIIMDGANIAHAEASKSVFCANNVRMALDYFRQRGHDEITIIMHGIRQSACNACFSREDLDHHFIFTSVRRLDNQAPMIADDDSVILEFASKKDAVVISNDQYRDWLIVRPEFRDVIENRVLPFSIRAGVFIISHFPMGKKKPALDQILAFPD